RILNAVSIRGSPDREVGWIWLLAKTRFLSPNSSINFMMIDIRYERGVYLPQQNLWLDPRDAKRFAFVSHAHSDHIALHDEILVSERTARLMQTRLPGTRIEHMLPFG